MRIKEELKKIKDSLLWKVKEAYWKRVKNRKEIDMATDVMFRVQAVLDLTEINSRERVEIRDFVMEPLLGEMMKNENHK